ncbi:MAG: helix-turn-helix domain-containing protein [Hyphomicrobiales bacterium]
MTNAKNIKNLRRQANLTQGQLAERLGLSRNAIAQWENGNSKPTKSNLDRLSKIFKTKIDEPEKKGNNESSRISESTTLQEKIPILGYAQGNPIVSANAIRSPIGYIHKPHSLANHTDLYAVYITGDSMSPEHKNSEIRIATPHIPFGHGDTVIILAKDAETSVETSYIKIYERTETTSAGKEILVFSQHNPQVDINFDKKNLVFTHKVLTYKELLGL